MWALDNRTPYAADSGWLRDPSGAEIWVVAVKATYDILPDGSTRLAAQQPPVHSGPQPHPGLESLCYGTDLGPSKAATDILLNGHAYAQDGQPVSELLVGFKVGNLSRSARVHGDRQWQHGLLFASIGPAEPFLKMPLVYERAFGGPEGDAPAPQHNPVGRGLVADEAGRLWLPNLESIDQPIYRQDDRPPPVSFGPIASHWPARRRWAGTYDRHWREQRYPLPPNDLDPRHWQLAPPEQQVAGYLRGGEEVVLINLTPPGFAVGGRLAFRLPRLTLAFQTRFEDGSRSISRSVIHSLILEPDFPRFSVVHHMTLPCHPKVNRLDRTRISEKRRPLDPPPLPVPQEASI
ncbi:DUF2169 family type VI secretion system accessory protein [Chitinimonas lacunae]|uniref:DUF2169 domain-containing protein n=1 Tax=Chitinimonas lacunae TaxID=1963018 RepID=A0ABV8MLS2_9NEIS